MPIAKCPTCGRKIDVPLEMMNRNVRCGGCRAVFVTASDGTSVRPAKRLKVAAASPEHVATRDVLKVAAFIIGPVALALVLIAGAFLLGRSFKASRELAEAKTQTVPTQAAAPTAPPRPKPETISPAVPPLPTTPKESPPPELPVTPPGHREKEEEEPSRPPKPKDPDPDDGFPKPGAKPPPRDAAPGLGPVEAVARVIKDCVAEDDKLKATYSHAASLFQQGAAVEAQLARVNAALLDPKLRNDQVRTRELTRQQQKLEDGLRQLTAKYEAEADAFLKARAAILATLNGPGALALRALRGAGGPPDKAALDVVLAGLELFVLSERPPLPRHATNSTFLDQEFWRETGECVGAAGGRHAPAVLRMFKSRNVVAQYAAAVAVARIGPTTAENDRSLQVELHDLLLSTSRGSRKERDARAKVIADAQAAIKARN